MVRRVGEGSASPGETGSGRFGAGAIDPVVRRALRAAFAVEWPPEPETAGRARQVTVLLNAGAGARRDAGAEIERVRAAFRAAGTAAAVHALPGARLSAAAHAHRRAGGIVVAAGGDGTVSAVADALAGSAAVLGVLPLGTLNHFARDAGIPLALDAAVRAIVAGRTRAVDVGEVNGRVFVNSSSLGLYPWAATRREWLWRAGRPCWPAILAASAAALRRLPLLHAVVATGSEAVHLATPVVFVGNNAYRMSRFAPVGRDALDRGELCLWAPRTHTRAGLLGLVLRALVGRPPAEGGAERDDFLVERSATLVVDPGRRDPLVSVDGEVLRLRGPLRYRVRPRALRLRVPREPDLRTGPGSGR